MAGPLTQPEFVWSWRLAAYVRDLADDGFAILKRDVQHCGSQIAEYRLDLSDPATAAALSKLKDAVERDSLNYSQKVKEFLRAT